jgi:hypothetical protein
MLTYVVGTRFNRASVAVVSNHRDGTHRTIVLLEAPRPLGSTLPTFTVAASSATFISTVTPFPTESSYSAESDLLNLSAWKALKKRRSTR